MIKLIIVFISNSYFTGEHISFLYSIHYRCQRLPLHKRKKPFADEVKRGCTTPSPLTWPSTMKSDGTKMFATTGSVDGCSFLPVTKFVRTSLCMNATWVLRFPSPYRSCRRETRILHQTAFRGSTPIFP